MFELSHKYVQYELPHVLLLLVNMMDSVEPAESQQYNHHTKGGGGEELDCGGKFSTVKVRYR